jgi:hypothetical protein
VAKVQRQFGINVTGSIRKIHFTNLYSVLNMEGVLLDGNTDSYDIVMNTHADLLPFYEKHNDNDTAIKGKTSKINLTYCHYPLLPYQIRNGLPRLFWKNVSLTSLALVSINYLRKRVHNII